MTVLTARNVALTDQILATPADEYPLPISTVALWRKIRGGPDERDFREVLAEAIAASNGNGPRPVGHGEVLRILNRLAKRGVVEKMLPEGMQSCYWRRWPQ